MNRDDEPGPGGAGRRRHHGGAERPTDQGIIDGPEDQSGATDSRDRGGDGGSADRSDRACEDDGEAEGKKEPGARWTREPRGDLGLTDHRSRTGTA